MDWVSRAVLAWRLSNTLGAEFCVEALEEALSRYQRLERGLESLTIDAIAHRDETDHRIVQQLGGRALAPGGRIQVNSENTHRKSKLPALATFATYFPAVCMVLIWKRLEGAKFKWPAISDGVMRLSAAQLAALLDYPQDTRAMLPCTAGGGGGHRPAPSTLSASDDNPTFDEAAEKPNALCVAITRLEGDRRGCG